jgi:hypothetical protein
LPTIPYSSQQNSGSGTNLPENNPRQTTIIEIIFIMLMNVLSIKNRFISGFYPKIVFVNYEK